MQDSDAQAQVLDQFGGGRKLMPTCWSRCCSRTPSPYALLLDAARLRCGAGCRLWIRSLTLEVASHCQACTGVDLTRRLLAPGARRQAQSPDRQCRVDESDVCRLAFDDASFSGAVAGRRSSFRPGRAKCCGMVRVAIRVRASRSSTWPSNGTKGCCFDQSRKNARSLARPRPQPCRIARLADASISPRPQSSHCPRAELPLERVLATKLSRTEMLNR